MIKPVSGDPPAFLETEAKGRAVSAHRKGVVLFRQGDMADAVFYVKKGKIKVTVVSAHGKGAVVAILGADEFLGEGCLIGQPKRLSTATAMTECVTMRVEKAEIVRVLHDEPAFSQMFVSHILARSARIEPQAPAAPYAAPFPFPEPRWNALDRRDTTTGPGYPEVLTRDSFTRRPRVFCRPSLATARLGLGVVGSICPEKFPGLLNTFKAPLSSTGWCSRNIPTTSALVRRQPAACWRMPSQNWSQQEMKNSKLMIVVATAALLAGTSFVFAQQQGGAPGGAPAGQMAPKSAGGQTTPAMPGAVHNGAAETKGKNAAEERGEQTKPNRAGEAQPNRNRETTGQAPQSERHENRTEGNKATHGATEERRLDQNRATEERGRDNERNRSTTGQGAAPNKGNITPEKRTQILQAFTRERSAPQVDRVDFDLAVGTAVPRSVRFVSVPGTIIAIEPRWRGYDYFMVGEQIVIVDPRSTEIVAIIDA
jgi:hypothetical protein